MPPAIVFAKFRKKPCTQRPFSSTALGVGDDAVRALQLDAELEAGLAHLGRRHLHVGVLGRRAALGEATRSPCSRARAGSRPARTSPRACAGRPASWSRPRRRARSTSACTVCSSRQTPSTHSPARSCASDPMVMRQPSLSAPTRFSFGTITSVKNTSAKSRRAAEVAQRPHLDARRVHVDDEQADALVLRHVGIGAHVAEALLGDHGVARPDLLAVDDEVVAVELGAGLQAGEVGARVGLAHADAPDRVAADRRRHELLLLVVAELEQARARRWRSRGSATTAGCAGAPSPRGRRGSGPASRCARRARAGSRGSSSRGRRGSPASGGPTRGRSPRRRGPRRRARTTRSPRAARARRGRRSAPRGRPRSRGRTRASQSASRPPAGARSAGGDRKKKGGTPGSVLANRASRCEARPSIVQRSSLVTCVTGRHPWTICATPALDLQHLARDAVGQVGREPAGARGRVPRMHRLLHLLADVGAAGEVLGEPGERDRRDGVDPHADALELARHHDRQRRDARLGRRVVRLAGVAVEAGLRRRVDDLGVDRLAGLLALLPPVDAANVAARRSGP